MNGDNFWQEDEETFRDIPDEVVEGQQAPAANVRTARPALPVPPVALPQASAPQNVTQYTVDVIEDEEDDYSDVMNDARIRLAQGQLYEIIMNHELFAGVEADEKAVKIVQREIRNFAKERMEIMLGMRQEKSAEETVVSSPFNSLEVEALKALAAAATGGASRTEEAQEYVAIPRSKGLNPITSKKAPVRQAAKPLAKSPASPVKRIKVDPNVELELQNDGVEREFIEEAKRQIATDTYKPLEKPISQMTESELIERNKQAAKRVGTTVKSSSAIPMPTAAQEEMIHTTRAQQASAHPQMQTILGLLNQPKKK